MMMMIPWETGETVGVDCPPGCTFNNYCGRACRQRASGISPRTAHHRPSLATLQAAGYCAPGTAASVALGCGKFPTSQKYSDLPRRLIMQRRDALRSISVAGGVAAASALPTLLASTIMTTLSDAAPLSSAAFSTLKKSARMPVIFLGHGSPMNAIEDNAWRRSWQSLGQSFGAGGSYPAPQLILCVSAHWLTRGWHLTAMAKPKTIHDFGGFRRRCSTSSTRRRARRLPPGEIAVNQRTTARASTITNGGSITAPGRC